MDTADLRPFDELVEKFDHETYACLAKGRLEEAAIYAACAQVLENRLERIRWASAPRPKTGKTGRRRAS